MNYKLLDIQVNNLMAFLDRVDIRGHAERQAMNEICYSLANPIKDEQIQEPTTEQTEEPPE